MKSPILNGLHRPRVILSWRYPHCFQFLFYWSAPIQRKSNFAYSIGVSRLHEIIYAFDWFYVQNFSKRPSHSHVRSHTINYAIQLKKKNKQIITKNSKTFLPRTRNWLIRKGKKAIVSFCLYCDKVIDVFCGY